MASLIDERPPVDKVFELQGWLSGQNPPQVIFGVGAVNRAGTEVKKFGATKVAIISDVGVKKAGLVAKITEILENEKLDVANCTDLEWEPTFETIRSATKFVRTGKFDFIIGLGGGAPCDSSKILSYLATNAGDVSEYVRLRGEPPPSKTWIHDPLPSMTIATTAGTGAEITHASVVIGKIGTTIKKGGASCPLAPTIVIMDPALALTLPPRQSVASAFDGLNHLLQLFLAPRSLPITDALLLTGIKIYYENIRTVYFHGQDIQARWNLSLVSMLWSLARLIAGEGFGGRYGMVSDIISIVGPKYGVRHTVAAATVLPYALEFALPASVGRLALVAEAFGEDIQCQPLRKAAFKAVELVAELVRDVELPTSLKEFNVLKEDLPTMVEYIMTYCLEDATGRRQLSRENLTELFNRMWEGRIGNKDLHY